MNNPLIERRDYGKNGKDILEKNLDELGTQINDELRSQFKNRKSHIDFELIITSVVSKIKS